MPPLNIIFTLHNKMKYDDGDYYSLAIRFHLNPNISLNLQTLGQNEYGCMVNGSGMIVS